ncbi:MAG: UDP-N-acetylbacillosamine N-acetyltransferase [Paraglaciecola sp.]|jgi:sugar O-acyltransferase (sialic acid O-acetyltransferase NeuD family)
MSPWRNLKVVSDKKNIIIIGAGGHGKVVADCARATKQFDNIQFLDGKYPEFLDVASWNVVGHQDDYANFDNKNTWYFVAIGNNALRHSWQQKLLKGGCKVATLVHPNACVAQDVVIGQGTLILAGCVINILSEIGEGCIINTGATVDHDCSIGEFSHIAPGVNLAGIVKLGVEVFIGVGSVVIQCISIGDKSIIGAGSTVLQNVPVNVTAVGTPAKVIKQHES